jgi:hypothetical protein
MEKGNTTNNIEVDEFFEIPAFSLVPTKLNRDFQSEDKYCKKVLPLISFNTTLLITPPLPYYTSILNMTFKNTSSENIDTSLVLPKDLTTAISSSKIFIGDKVLNMKLMNAEVAREKMKKAVEKGKTAAIGELTTRGPINFRKRPNVFKFRIGNLPPGISLNVEIKLTRQIDIVKHGINLLQ